jgi:hypothetical protein
MVLRAVGQRREHRHVELLHGRRIALGRERSISLGTPSGSNKSRRSSSSIA